MTTAHFLMSSYCQISPQMAEQNAVGVGG